MEAVEMMAADSILKRGLRYPIPAPFFLRLFGKKTIKITITQLNYGTELRVSKLILSINDIPEDNDKVGQYQFMRDNYDTILRIVALSSLNKKHTFFMLKFRMYQLRRLTLWQLLELYTSIKRYSSVSPFINITRLAMTTRITIPNLGQIVSGS